MEFFTVNDFEVFERVSGQRIDYTKEDHDLASRQLNETGIVAKTAHWAILLEEEGYAVEYDYKWQNSGYFKKYTWARVYLPGLENTRIFYTVGVGSRYTKELNPKALEYKIDCLRSNKNALHPRQSKLVENYIDSEIPLDNWIQIPQDKIGEYNWERLIDETTIFIEKHRDHYERLVEAVWPNGVENFTGENDLREIDNSRPFQIKEGLNVGSKKVTKVALSKREIRIEHRHAEMQEIIYHELEKKKRTAKVGTENPTGFGKYIDIVTEDKNGEITFYEIKSGSSALGCIREALGQLLEYNFFPKDLRADKLIIVSPHGLTKSETEYFQHLREKVGLSIFYQKFDMKKKVLDEMV